MQDSWLRSNQGTKVKNVNPIPWPRGPPSLRSGNPLCRVSFPARKLAGNATLALQVLALLSQSHITSLSLVFLHAKPCYAGFASLALQALALLSQSRTTSLSLVATGPSLTSFGQSLGVTPRVGLEPTTLRLTAECSTIELSRKGIDLL